MRGGGVRAHELFLPRGAGARLAPIDVKIYLVSVYFLALVLGAVPGLGPMAAPTAVSIAARMGRLELDGTWLAWLGYTWTPWILGIFAIAELIVDQLPTTASRTTPLQFSSPGVGR